MRNIRWLSITIMAVLASRASVSSHPGLEESILRPTEETVLRTCFFETTLLLVGTMLDDRELRKDHTFTQQSARKSYRHLFFTTAKLAETDRNERISLTRSSAGSRTREPLSRIIGSLPIHTLHLLVHPMAYGRRRICDLKPGELRILITNKMHKNHYSMSQSSTSTAARLFSQPR